MSEIPVAVGREATGISRPPRTGGLAPIRYTVLKMVYDVGQWRHGGDSYLPRSTRFTHSCAVCRRP